MPALSLAKAQKIMKATVAKADEMGLKPLSVVVLDERGAIKLAQSADGTSLLRFEVAFGKAYGALGMGVGSRAITKMALERPHFVNAFAVASDGRMTPAPGGVLIRDAKGAVIGAVGVSGDTSDNDETAAMAGIAAAGFTGDPGVG